MTRYTLANYVLYIFNELSKPKQKQSYQQRIPVSVFLFSSQLDSSVSQARFVGLATEISTLLRLRQFK